MKTYIYLPNSRRSESSAEMKNYLFWYDHGVVNIANKLTKRSILDVAAALDPQVLAFF